MSASATDRPYNQFRALRPEYLAICDGNACAALLLDLFAYWTQVRASNSEQAVSGGAASNDLWFYRSLPDITSDLYGAFGRAAIRSALKILLDNGHIETRRQSSAPWDRTMQYRLKGGCGTDPLHGAISNDVHGAISNDDAVARPSPPSEAQLEIEKREKKETKSREKAITYEGQRVDPETVAAADTLLADFNDRAQRKLSSFKASGQPSEHLRQIIGALLSNPGATVDEWREGLRRAVEHPPGWADGRALIIGDVFGPRAAAHTLAPASAAVNGGGRRETNGDLIRAIRGAQAQAAPVDLLGLPPGIRP